MSDKCKVLFIDDEEDLLELLDEHFSSLGFEVYTANGGEEGLKKFRQNKDVDLVICDISMPRVRGLDVIKKIRMLSEDVPFVFFTGFGSRSNMIEASKYGAFDFVTKPDVTGLLEVAKRAVEESKSDAKSSDDPLSEYQKLLSNRDT
ncbi:MAG: hypothetical protein CME64_01980 [Halobacteriovoraceae bacterium]|nr:hypothetical protein [Halobacteriovoraceae bacterium]|tara:strand:+ start:27837 stop:28277 length:441 start_codon:yes stop_codon:yes gene_type:complete